MHPHPYDFAVYLIDAPIEPHRGLARDTRPPPEPIRHVGRVMFATVSTDGTVWLYIEPSDAFTCIHRVEMTRSRAACAAEVHEAQTARRESLTRLASAGRGEIA